MPTPVPITWNIVGQTPLFQSNPSSMWAEPEDEAGAKRGTKAPMYAGEKQAFQTAQGQLYIDGDGRNYHPAMGFLKALLKACPKRTLGRDNALSIVTLAVSPVEEHFLLLDPATLLNGKKPKPISPKSWMVDKRRAINHNKNKDTGGVAVVAIRPKWNLWGGRLTFKVDQDFFKTLVGLTELLNIAGEMFGVGVGRRRLMGMRRQQEIWSDMGMGRFSATLCE